MEAVNGSFPLPSVISTAEIKEKNYKQNLNSKMRIKNLHQASSVKKDACIQGKKKSPDEHGMATQKAPKI